MLAELKILVPLEEWQLLKKTAKKHESCSEKSNEEWERLKRIEMEHQKCQGQLKSSKTNSLATVEGAGTFPDETGDHRISDVTFVMPSIKQTEENKTDSGRNDFEKNVILLIRPLRFHLLQMQSRLFQNLKSCNTFKKCSKLKQVHCWIS